MSQYLKKLQLLTMNSLRYIPVDLLWTPVHMGPWWTSPHRHRAVSVSSCSPGPFCWFSSGHSLDCSMSFAQAKRAISHWRWHWEISNCWDLYLKQDQNPAVSLVLSEYIFHTLHNNEPKVNRFLYIFRMKYWCQIFITDYSCSSHIYR